MRLALFSLPQLLLWKPIHYDFLVLYYGGELTVITAGSCHPSRRPRLRRKYYFYKRIKRDKAIRGNLRDIDTRRKEKDGWWIIEVDPAHPSNSAQCDIIVPLSKQIHLEDFPVVIEMWRILLFDLVGTRRDEYYFSHDSLWKNSLKVFPFSF